MVANSKTVSEELNIVEFHPYFWLEGYRSGKNAEHHADALRRVRANMRVIVPEPNSRHGRQYNKPAIIFEHRQIKIEERDEIDGCHVLHDMRHQQNIIFFLR